MRFKTLKHKTLPDTYASIQGFGEELEVWQSGIPELRPIEAEIDALKWYFTQHDKKKVVEQLEDYELVEVILYEAGKQKIPIEYLTYKDGTKEFYSQLKHWHSVTKGAMGNNLYKAMIEKLEELIPSIKKRI